MIKRIIIQSNRISEKIKTNRRQTSFRLRQDLLAKMKIAAKKENRSLNNYVESILLNAAYKKHDIMYIFGWRDPI